MSENPFNRPGAQKLEAAANDGGNGPEKAVSPEEEIKLKLKDYQAFIAIGLIFNSRGGPDIENPREVLADIFKDLLNEDESDVPEKLWVHSRLRTASDHFTRMKEEGRAPAEILEHPIVKKIDSVVTQIKNNPDYLDPDSFPIEDFVEKANLIISLTKPGAGEWAYRKFGNDEILVYRQKK